MKSCSRPLSRSSPEPPRTPISAARTRLGADTVVQGNLDPALVLAGTDVALAGADKVLAENAGHPGHIFNLGHGISQFTPPEHVSALVEAVHSHSRKLRQ